MIRSAESAGVGSVIFLFALDLWCSMGLKETKGDFVHFAHLCWLGSTLSHALDLG